MLFPTSLFLPGSRSRRSSRVTTARRSTRSTGFGASPTTCRVPQRSADADQWPRSWLDGGPSGSRGAARPQRAHRLPRARVACALAVETLELIGGCRWSTSATPRAGSDCWPRPPGSRRRTAGDRCGAARPATGDADIAAARDALGERAPEIEAEGAALTLDQAAELAMRAHGTRKRPATGWASLSPPSSRSSPSWRKARRTRRSHRRSRSPARP